MQPYIISHYQQGNFKQFKGLTSGGSTLYPMCRQVALDLEKSGASAHFW